MVLDKEPLHKEREDFISLFSFSMSKGKDFFQV